MFHYINNRWIINEYFIIIYLINFISYLYCFVLINITFSFIYYKLYRVLVILTQIKIIMFINFAVFINIFTSITFFMISPITNA